MKKQTIIIIIGIILIALLSALIYFYLTGENPFEKTEIEVTPAAEISEIPLEKLLELNFDTPEDGHWFFAFDETTTTDDEAYKNVSDSSFEVYMNAGIKLPLDENHIFHFRINIPEKNDTSIRNMVVNTYSGMMEDMQYISFVIPVKGFVSVKTYLDNTRYNIDIAGKGFGSTFKSGDLILFRIDADKFGVLLADADSSDYIKCSVFTLPDKWQDTIFNVWFHCPPDRGQDNLSIDFVNVYRGDIKEYLETSVYAYPDNKDLIDKQIDEVYTIDGIN